MQGVSGTVIDLIALLGTVLGVATSIGLAVASLLSGLTRGIRRLSEINVWLSTALLFAILFLGPTTFLLGLLPGFREVEPYASLFWVFYLYLF